MDMLLLAPTVTALQTLFQVCRACAGPHDIVYNTTKTVCMLARPKQLQGRFSTRVRLGNEELSFVEEFRYLGHIMTAYLEMMRILKNNLGGKLQLAMCWSENSHLHLLTQKSNCSSHIVTKFMDVLFGHSFQNSVRKLTVSYSDTFKRHINVPRYTSSSMAFSMNATDHINVVFRKFAYSLMSRVTASLNCIVTAIVNGDAYHQSPLMDKWESMLYV